jgi:hypothetical protein
MKKCALFTHVLYEMGLGILPEERKKGLIQTLKNIKDAFMLNIAIIKFPESEDAINDRTSILESIREKERKIKTINKLLMKPGLTEEARINKYTEMLILVKKADYLIDKTAMQTIRYYTKDSLFKTFNIIKVCLQKFNFRFVPRRDGLSEDDAQKYLLEKLNKIEKTELSLNNCV